MMLLVKYQAGHVWLGSKQTVPFLCLSISATGLVIMRVPVWGYFLPLEPGCYWAGGSEAFGGCWVIPWTCASGFMGLKITVLPSFHSTPPMVITKSNHPETNVGSAETLISPILDQFRSLDLDWSERRFLLTMRAQLGQNQSKIPSFYSFAQNKTCFSSHTQLSF